MTYLIVPQIAMVDDCVLESPSRWRSPEYNSPFPMERHFHTFRQTVIKGKIRRRLSLGDPESTDFPVSRPERLLPRTPYSSLRCRWIVGLGSRFFGRIGGSLRASSVGSPIRLEGPNVGTFNLPLR
uniref:(northern house mosquito) hypothetical protein n=1 Tax=Culex pipiens TaxID=7175 RepID=A0A8D8K5B0_CULPI